MKKLDPFFISLLLRVNGLIIILTSKFILRVLYILKHKIMVLSVLLNIHGVSRLPPKVWGTFLQKKSFLKRGNFLGKFMGRRVFYMGELMIRSC